MASAATGQPISWPATSLRRFDAELAAGARCVPTVLTDRCSSWLVSPLARRRAGRPRLRAPRRHRGEPAAIGGMGEFKLFAAAHKQCEAQRHRHSATTPTPRPSSAAPTSASTKPSLTHSANRRPLRTRRPRSGLSRTDLGGVHGDRRVAGGPAAPSRSETLRAAQHSSPPCHDKPCVFSGLMSGSQPVPGATR